MQVAKLPRDTPADAVIEQLRSVGACVVENRMTEACLAQFLDEAEPLVKQSAFGDGTFQGLKTQRTGALISSSVACREIALDELVLKTAKGFLSPFCQGIQLMLTQIISIHPDEEAQTLHRDRQAWGGYLLREIETQVNTMWALTDFTLDNGATRIVPGSAAWSEEREPNADEILQVEMKQGSVLIFTGSVFHSGGENRSDDVRMGVNIDYCLDWLRQEENQYLSCPPEIARSFPQQLTELIGYTMGGLVLGYYSDPYQSENRAAKEAEHVLGFEPRQVADVDETLSKKSV